MSLGQRTAPEGTDPNAPLPEGSALPELTTYSFVPAEEAAGCNMVELAISGEGTLWSVNVVQGEVERPR